MPYRWFYSTDESDTALKSVLDASKFSRDYSRNENALTDGVFEYKVWIEQDSEFLLLQNKIDNMRIRALASPVRVNQFGNIRPDNYFDTTKYSAGCTYRDTGTLSDMILFLDTFVQSGSVFVQRDLDIQGSASLGTVKVTYSSNYTKTYNIPLNGTINDRTLIKVIRDSTTLSLTQTNATCNNVMFDYASFSGRISATSVTHTVIGSPTVPTDATTLASIQDSKISGYAEFVLSLSNQVILQIDYGSILSSKNLWIFYLLSTGGNNNFDIDISLDGTSWTQLQTGNVSETTWKKFSNKTFRYVRLTMNTGSSGMTFRPYEIVVS